MQMKCVSLKYIRLRGLFLTLIRKEYYRSSDQETTEDQKKTQIKKTARKAFLAKVAALARNETHE